MTDQINDYTLNAECKSIALDIMDQIDDPDEWQDNVWQWVDGHQWVIYHYQSHQICLTCNTDAGEEFLEEMGMPETSTYDGLASAIAFGEMVSRVSTELQTLIDEKEAA